MCRNRNVRTYNIITYIFIQMNTLIRYALGVFCSLTLKKQFSHSQNSSVKLLWRSFQNFHPIFLVNFLHSVKSQNILLSFHFVMWIFSTWVLTSLCVDSTQYFTCNYLIFPFLYSGFRFLHTVSFSHC